MIAIWTAIALRVAGTLVLDARPGAGDCGMESRGEDIVVCAPGERQTTRLDATIDGAPAVLVVEPGGSEALECNPAFVARARIFGRGQVDLADVGPVRIRGAEAEVSLAVAGRARGARLRWAGRPAIRGADCVAGPAALPFDAVRFLLGPARPDATAVAMPFHRPSYGHANARWRIGDHDLAVRFELEHARTVLSASSARAVAPVLGATATGPVTMDEIAWTVARPVRRLATRRPLVIAGLTIGEPHVRVADYGDAMRIRSVDPDTIAADDIQVAAKRGKPGGMRLVRVGRDDLSRCVSIEVDRRARRITLVC